jgi:hypothetical protein
MSPIPVLMSELFLGLAAPVLKAGGFGGPLIARYADCRNF